MKFVDFLAPSTLLHHRQTQQPHQEQQLHQHRDWGLVIHEQTACRITLTSNSEADRRFEQRQQGEKRRSNQ